MFAIKSEVTAALSRELSNYSPCECISRVAGLLTAPRLQGNTLRLELLAHLCVAYCSGTKKPGYSDVEGWLNKELGQEYLVMQEDPVEDVFVTNVQTPEGNRRIFEGIWESNDYFLQCVLDTLEVAGAPQGATELLPPAYALLRLSDLVAERVGLTRWATEPSSAKEFVPVGPATRVNLRASAVRFSFRDLEDLHLDKEVLSPFILSEEARRRLTQESTGDSSLERYPLVEFDDCLVLALPHAVSPAIRRFVLSRLRGNWQLQAFGEALSQMQARQLEKDGLQEIKANTVSLSPPQPEEREMPSLHSWLLKYDANKYIHVVLIHDRLDWLEAQGLSSFTEYPEKLRKNFEKYLNDTARYCLDQPDCAEGMTLIVMGGLGRGFMLGFNEWPSGWYLSTIRISDLIMLAGEMDQPIRRYLKCIKQKEWAERRGVFFQNINGDFNFYCYWDDLKYQLVPRDLPVGSGSFVAVAHDFVMPFRKKVRKLNDRHVLETVEGKFVAAMRYGRDAYFKSMQDKPIYASLDHINAGVLAGAVETERGASWLILQPRENDDESRYLLYEMWSGFLGLFDRLVFEVESLSELAISEPIEIQLDFSELVIPNRASSDYDSRAATVPTVGIMASRRVAEVKFPPDFLTNFQQPDNIGERLVITALAQALLGLLVPAGDSINDEMVNVLVGKVLSHEGMRVIHLFHAYDRIEQILAQQPDKATFLAQEDFVFSKLKLSEGCTKTAPGEMISSKNECNKFLHKVVDKVWDVIRNLLRQFDRTSVIRQLLAVHEAIIRDRSHWSRTAQAVLALYASGEDVYEIVQEREAARNRTALPVRALLEMAICECPISDGRELSSWDLDDLMAKAVLLIEVATDSDAIKLELVDPQITIYANGEYFLDHGFHENVIRPFLFNYIREEFDDAAASYSSHYDREEPKNPIRLDEILSAEFNSAFKAEYGLTPDEAIDGLVELLELAVECDSHVVETTVAEVTGRLIHSRGMTPEVCEVFLKTFGLFHRQAWDNPPDGYGEEDIYPWRFRRRLSATVKPIFLYGDKESDKILYGVGTLKQGFHYLLERTENGQLPDRFYSSVEMKRYIGSVNNERGHAFARTVADKLRTDGWDARNEVNMTELGASSELGDIDVLAWKPGEEVLIIECKRLQLAKTVAEIAEICRRFQGEVADELDKHLRRVTWVKGNVRSLERLVGFNLSAGQIDDRLVTNTHVPMKYLNSLPIAADKIGPLNSPSL